MKDKEIRIRTNSEFDLKVDYLQKINGYKNKSDAIRKTIEKEYIKETLTDNEYGLIKTQREFYEREEKRKQWRKEHNIPEPKIHNCDYGEPVFLDD